MELTWNGQNITRSVNITGCRYREVSSGRCDSLEITFDGAESWYRWKPEQDDVITMRHGGVYTGKMFLNAVIPEDGRYRILATSLPWASSRRAWGSWYGMTLRGLSDLCAAECGMGAMLYGINGALSYPYILREMEGAAALLGRVCRWEGVMVKAYDGVFRCVYLPYAQGMAPSAVLTIGSRQEGVTYTRRANTRYASMIVQTPFGSASASDTSASGGSTGEATWLPAMNHAQAGRWARGLLMMHNREAEEIRLETELDLRLSAMNRVDVTGETDMTGQWMVDESEHDLFRERTSARLLRVTDTIM